MNALTIAHTTIHQDANGRYCLNDLHKASGGENRHRPSLWMANKQTKALIDELLSEQKHIYPKAGIPALGVVPQSRNSCFGIAPVEVIQGGEWNGTFVVKELVYAYAMWISPAFTLKVIRAYDALVTGQLADEKRHSFKSERAYFNKYPNDRTIRTMAYQGEPYWFIGQMVKRAAGTVGKAVRRMIEWDYMDEARLRSIRSTAAPIRQLRRKRFHQYGLPGF